MKYGKLILVDIDGYWWILDELSRFFGIEGKYS